MQFSINSPRVVHQTIDGETVIIDFDTGVYYSTDRVGAEIWNQVAAGESLGCIIQAVADQYAGDRASIDKAVRGFLDELEREALILVDRSANPAALPEPPSVGPARGRPDFMPPALQKYTDMEDLLLLDPIHEVDTSGWPARKA